MRPDSWYVPASYASSILIICRLMKNSHTFSKICGYAMFLLILAQIVLVLASWLITAAMPDVFPRSLLSPEGIRWFFGTFTANLQSPWLVWLLLISIAWGTLRASGLLNYAAFCITDPPSTASASPCVWLSSRAFSFCC